MASDVARRIDTNRPVKHGNAVAYTPTEYFSFETANTKEKADIDAGDVARHTGTGRNRLYYTTGEADPADGGP